MPPPVRAGTVARAACVSTSRPFVGAARPPTAGPRRSGAAEGGPRMDVVVDEHPTGEPTVVSVRGHLDIDSAPELRDAVEGLLDRDVTRIVVDLAELDFCDSIGLST